jgi:hypothetical protein
MGTKHERNDRIRAEAAQYVRDQGARADALAIIELFNSRLAEVREPWFMPTINGALAARYPWMIVLCRSCDTVIDFDLRMKPRKQDATILTALRDVRCPRCNGNGRPRIMRLAKQASMESLWTWRE